MLIVSSLIVTAQRQADNWYFGTNDGLNFSTGTPVNVPDGQLNTVEGEASISDAGGQLLFYTDGVTIWNKLNQVMLNGTGLLGDNSSTQSAIIVPEPGNDSLFFVFTVAAFAMPAGLKYSVVNMNADNGLGAVVIKNIQLLTPTAEKITAVKHCNNKDIWVLTRKYVSDEYYAWLVTSSGVLPTPVISATGMFIGDVTGVGFDEIGYLKVSPDAKKLAAAHFSQTTSSNRDGFTEFAGFNNATGQVSKSFKIYDYPPPLNSVTWGSLPYGLDFSPNSKFLYVSNTAYTVQGYHYAVFTIDQYDVSINDSALIAQSHYVADTSSHYKYQAIQLANNQKIYVTNAGASSLSVINNPNIQGAGCNFIEQGVILNSQCRSGLPSFIQNYFDDFYNKYDFSSNNNCTSLHLQFQLSTTIKVDSVIWTFGDIPAGANNLSKGFSPLHSFTQIGSYNITALVYKNNGCTSITDTIVKTILVNKLALNLGNDTTNCIGDTLILHDNISNTTNLWSNGTTGDTIQIVQPGIYWLNISSQGCSVTDSITVSNHNLPQFTLGADTTICNPAIYILSPQTSYPGATFLWNNNNTSATLNINTTGNYWLKLVDNAGCTWRDTIAINHPTSSKFTLGADTAICTMDTLFINVSRYGAGTYLWNTGETTDSIKAYQPGVYWCALYKDGCNYRDSLSLLLKPIPSVYLGADTTICEDDETLLNAGTGIANYLWQDGSTGNTYTVTRPGEYTVSVNLNGCTSSDSINVYYTLKPHFNLGKNDFICPGEIIVLQPVTIPAWQLLWQDESTGPTFTVNLPGIYTLQATNNCGFTKDTIEFTRGLCHVYVPNAFSPNGDVKNDVFKVGGTEMISVFDLQIYNRYGQLVYQSTDKTKGWDGTFNNQPCATGAYIYVLIYKDNDSPQQQRIKGNVVLFR